MIAKAKALGRNRLSQAVRQNRTLTHAGLREFLFTWMFSGLVYPQIWEDPDVDMEALAITPDSHVVTIASGGCNVLSYLIADPARVTAVDLNKPHVALNRLKVAAALNLPSAEAFGRFFGGGRKAANIEDYQRHIAPKLDAATRTYWESRGKGGLGAPRIAIFARGLYRFGLLGRFIGAGHALARLHGVDPRDALEARTRAEQRAFFETTLAPLFDKPLIRWLCSCHVSLFGLGIPPAQYDALAAGGTMASVLRERLERLTCDFDFSDNYFAWQAFGRGYADDGPLPPYLQKAHFNTIRARAGRVEILNRSFTEYLETRPDRSLDRYVLLDAQDWMNDTQLNALWREITRTAKPGTRVIFRTAAKPSLLPGRLDAALLARWRYETAYSRELTARDRSAIYGGFHLYVLEERP